MFTPNLYKEVEPVIEKNNVVKIRQDIAKHIGAKVKLESNRKHNKSTINEGIIANVYPSIFTIEVNDGDNSPIRTVSYSYTDIFTNSVEITLCS